MNAVWFEERGAVPADPFVVHSQNVLREGLHRSLTINSLPLLLRYEDRNSMAYSVESRVPFLTSQLVQWIFSLPEEYLIDTAGTTKAIFRSAMAGTVPQPVLARRDKIGFVPPERTWLMHQSRWVEKQLMGDVAHAIPAVHKNRMLKQWEELQTSKSPLSASLWRWINLIRWVECFSVGFE
jgi:asparagine synthase (glutamine-hydrolysing)